MPFAELAPLQPALRPVWGLNIVVNDNDGGDGRGARLEWSRGAMTYGKRPAQFHAIRTDAPLPDGRVAVLAGLDPGERVVTDGDAARRALLGERG